MTKPTTVSIDEECPDSYLLWAILSTVFCFLPLGIPAIVMAAQVSSLWDRGKYDEAREKARKAKKFTTIAFWIGISILTLVILIIVLLVAFIKSSIEYIF